MNGGGAIATFGFNVSQSSLVSGHGTIVLLDGGTRFDIAGTIRPAGGDLLIWSQAADVLDLDGNVGGLEPGFVDVTSTGVLEFRGSRADPFSGERQVGFRHDIEFDTALEIDGSLRFMSSLGSRLIAPAVTFGDGAQVTVDAAIGHVDAESDWGPNATIELLALTDELHLGQDSYFAASTSWSGRGLLVNEAPAVMSFEDASEVGVAIRNEGVLEIGSTTGFIVLEDLEQAPGAQITVDIEGTMPGVEYDQIYVTGDLTLGGSLQISTPPDYAVEPGNAFEIISVDGVSIGSFDGYAEGDLVGSDIYQKSRYDLCPDCYQKYIKNPIGRETPAHLGFSQN